MWNIGTSPSNSFARAASLIPIVTSNNQLIFFSERISGAVLSRKKNGSTRTKDYYCEIRLQRFGWYRNFWQLDSVKVSFFVLLMQSFEEETEKTSFSRQKPTILQNSTFPSQIKVKRKNIIAIPGAQKFPGVTRKLR